MLCGALIEKKKVGSLSNSQCYNFQKQIPQSQFSFRFTVVRFNSKSIYSCSSIHSIFVENKNLSTETAETKNKKNESCLEVDRYFRAIPSQPITTTLTMTVLRRNCSRTRTMYRPMHQNSPSDVSSDASMHRPMHRCPG